MRYLPRKRPPATTEPVEPVPVAGGAQQSLMVRLRAFLVVRRVKAVLSAPGTTAAAAATGIVIGVLVGVALSALLLSVTLTKDSDS